MLFDLKLTDGRVVQREGRDGEDAARRYVADHRDAAVIAWRRVREECYGIFTGSRRMRLLQPGDRDW